MYGYQPQPRAVTRPLPPAGVAAFPTTWPLTENPISQGSIWTQGGTVGIDWQNTRSNGGAPGIAYGVGASSGFDDCIATVQGQGFSTSKHFAQITINKVGGYVPPDSHEVEALVGFTISANSAKGYELTHPFGVNLTPTRFNGPLGNFDTTVFTTISGASFQVADGDIVKTIFDSTSGSPIMTVFLNGVQQWQFTDTTAGKILTGFPGKGFFARAGVNLDMTKYCNRGFDCGNA
jgi:hypothetical protein